MEVLLRVVGPKPNGFLWPTPIKLTTTQVAIWLEQEATALDAELEKQAVRLPRRDLWHAMLFDTVGELLRRELGPDYVPYAVQQGLYQGDWGDYRLAIEKHWHPYLNGDISLAAALERLVGDMARLPPRPNH